MSLLNDEHSKVNGAKRKFKISIMLILFLVIGYFGYFLYRSHQATFLEPEDYVVELKTDNITLAGEKWLEAYASQYEAHYVLQSKKIEGITISKITVLEDHVVQIDFSVTPKKLSEDNLLLWQGTKKDSSIDCQWVLWFDAQEKVEELKTYKVLKLERPAAYDLAKYQLSGQKEKDEAFAEYQEEIPFDMKQYTYKIQDQIYSISYDGGNSFKEVPIDMDILGTVGDGNSYYNKLQEGSYSISPVKTAIVYGGTRETQLSILYSDDFGETFISKTIPCRISGIRSKFVNFITKELGHIIIAGDRSMSQEIQIILKTEDGGETWEETGEGASSWLLQSGGFVKEDLGFLSYPKVEGQETNLYRTIDGGLTYEPIMVPEYTVEVQGTKLTPFIQPETPYFEDGELTLLVSQGANGDFEGGTTKAKYKSTDEGKTFIFVEIYKPKSNEPG